VTVFSAVVYFFFSHDSLYFVSFLAELIRTFGIGLLLQKILKEKSVSEISLKTQQLYVVVFATRLAFKVFYERDFLYAFVELLALFLTVVIVYLMRFKFRATYSDTYDTVNEYFLVAICIATSIFLHPSVTPSWTVNVLWAFSTYLESVTLVPQIWIVHRVKRVEDATAHYIASLFLSRVLELSFWIIALVARNYLRMWSSLGYYVIATELLHSLLLSDFIFYYVRSYWKGMSLVLPAMVGTPQ